MNKLKIITGSGILAIKQVEEVMMLLPNVSFEIVETQSFSDKQKEISQYIPAYFSTLELHEAIVAGEADIAIYPAKDLPYPFPASLEIIALTVTPDQSDSLICNDAKKLSDAPTQALIDIISYPLQGQLAVIAKTGNVNLKDLFSPLDCRSNYGKVYIAGFGPGDPELLTVKAYRALENADIIFYDCLLDKTYLDNFKGEKISSGKRKDNHLKEQDEINELLYQAAISGKKVVRIKGGDPLIFGRGGEEFFYLKKRLIDVEIIPGITSALAAAAIAGIPLTQRNISSSVAFGTGHPLSSIHIPDTDTVVFYMPASNLHLILNKLIEAGRSEDTPIALIENISLPLQRIITGTLKELLLKPYTYHSPLLIIVGETVKLNYVI
jgi:uroporphyrinogen III methyltransferase/synthase